MANSEADFYLGILKNDPRVLQEIYKKFLPAVHKLVRFNGNGSLADAKDVFQEGLVVIFHHAARPGFELHSTFQAYLVGICRFIWLRQLKKNARVGVTFEEAQGLSIDSQLEQEVFESEKRALYMEKFEQMGSDCKQVLQRFFDREPLGNIAQSMGYTPDYIKKKNKTCKEKLMESIQSDSRFRELSNPASLKNYP